MREPSYMIIIPMKEEDIMDPKIFIDNVFKSEHVKIKDIGGDEESGMIVTFQVDDAEYSVGVSPVDVEIPPYVRLAHSFSEDEFKLLDETRAGLSVCMDFEGDNNKCFYDQIRIINAMYPEMLAVLDCPSEKLLSGKWVSLAANSSVLPAPRYLFTVQAVTGDGDEVWLHTHGLKRCGLYELEILCSDRDHYNNHYKMIESFALHMLESDEPVEPGDAFTAGQASGYELTLTAVDWKEALEYYPDAELGTAEDREDDVHGEDTCVLMIYKNDNAIENKIYTPVHDFNRFLGDNPMFYFSKDETRRMSALAVERTSYLLKAFENKDYEILLKIGLVVDEEYWDNGKPQKEYIWFRLSDVKDDKVICVLTQEPYYVSNIRKGDTGTYPLSDITDWLVYTDERSIGPDDAYLLM